MWLKNKGILLKAHEVCPNPKCICQKQIILIPRQFQVEGTGFENKKEKKFDEASKDWDSFLRPAVNTLAPVLSMAVAAKRKNPQLGQATTNILKSISGGKILSVTNLHSGAGLRLLVM